MTMTRSAFATAPALHDEIRAFAAAFDAGLARLVSVTAESGRLEEDCPRDSAGVPHDAGWSALLAWDRTNVDPAKQRAGRAWESLRAAVASTGHAALVSGGRLYFLNAARPELDVIHENEHEFASWLVDSRRVLNLDAPL